METLREPSISRLLRNFFSIFFEEQESVIIRRGSIQQGSIWHSSIQQGSIQRGSIQQQRGSIQQQRGSIQQGSIQQVSIRQGSIQQGSIQQVSIRQGSIQQGSSEFPEGYGTLEKITKFFMEVIETFEETSEEFFTLTSNLRYSKIKIIGDGCDDPFCHLLDKIIDVLNCMIYHVETDSSDFTSFRKLANKLLHYTEELSFHVEDAKNQAEEVLRDYEKKKDKTIKNVLFPIAGTAAATAIKVYIPTKAAGFADKLGTLFSSQSVGSVGCCIIILAGTIAIAISMINLQKHIDDLKGLIQALKKLNTKLSSLNERIPKNEEKYKIITSDKVYVTKQLKTYRFDIEELKDLILAE